MCSLYWACRVASQHHSPAVNMLLGLIDLGIVGKCHLNIIHNTCMDISWPCVSIALECGTIGPRVDSAETIKVVLGFRLKSSNYHVEFLRLALSTSNILARNRFCSSWVLQRSERPTLHLWQDHAKLLVYSCETLMDTTQAGHLCSTKRRNVAASI